MIFTANDETLIYCESRLAKNPKANIFLIHGLGEHSGRYDEFSEYLCSADFSVHCLDLRGHGRSAGPRGHVVEFENYYADVENWIQFLENENLIAPCPCIVIGHSLGGLIASGFMTHFKGNLGVKLAGLVLSAPAFGAYPSTKNTLQKWLSAKVPGLIAHVQVPNGIDPKLISHNEAVVQDYINDPLVHSWVTPSFGAAYFKEVENLQKMALGVGVPVCVLIAGEEKIVDNQAILDFVTTLKERAEAPPVTVKKYEGAYHEILNDHSGDKAKIFIKEWIDKCLQSRENSKNKNLKTGSFKSSKKKATEKAILP